MQRLIIYCSFLFLVSCNSKEDAPQGDNWVLTNRKVHSDKLNMFGFPDTTYTKNYSYENLSIKDSSEMFTVNKYDDNRRLILRSFFFVKNGSPLLQSQSRYSYSGSQVSEVIDEVNGVLTKNEKYTYDTSGKVLTSSIVRLKNYDKIFQRANDEIVPKDTLLHQGYDTLFITYKYDATNKNIGGDFADSKGNLIRRDVNIYSGASPVSSSTIGPKGDTLQRITYVQAGSKLTSQIENADFSIITAMNSGYMLGRITLDKKKNEKLKQDWGYANGRVTEERFYVNQPAPK